jgi:PGF-pre-PGF domain-containing protein
MRNRANVSAIALVFVFLISTLATASAKEITVANNSDADFTSIQAAINAAYPGDKIIVKPDTYVEDITINKNLTIVSESENPSDTKIKSARGSDDIFSVWSNGVSIKGFSINGARYAGIHLFGVTECNITNNNLSNNVCGIDLYMFSSGNILDNNQISDSVTGISLGDSRFNSLRNNSFSNCGSAISLFDSRNNTVQNNIIFNNSEGISLIGESNGNTLTSNIVNSNLKTGLHLYGTSDNHIYNNYFNNTENVEFEESESDLGSNIWNKAKTAGTSIVGGPYLGGNFWAKPDGTGFSQISVDSDKDGIGDLSYNISENEFDYLPLVSLSGPEKPLIPGTKGRIIVKADSGLKANFNTNVSEGYAPLSVKFTDSSVNATGWNWDFGDENTSIDQNPEHTYSEAGNFAVKLTVNNANDTDSKTSEIIVHEAPYEEKILPAADFSANPTSGDAPLSVNFTDLSKNAIRWNWDFDDGNTSNVQNPVNTYSKAGKYTVNLTVTNENGTDSKVLEITVNEAPIEEKVPPVADFDAYPTNGYAPLSVHFTDHSQKAMSINWDFDNDGVTDETSDPVPVYVYTAPGQYTVNLTVSNENGSDSETKEITVNEASNEDKILPAADFSATPASGNAPLSVNFTDHSQNADSWNWDFNDGYISPTPNPTHTFSKAGKYTVNLTVTNENGTDWKALEITVHEAPVEEKILPVANFNAYPTSGNAPLSVQFTDLSQNAALWSWDFNNDGANDSSEISPNYTYTVPGTYRVNLMVSNANGTAYNTALINVLDGSSSGGSSSGGDSEGSNSHSSSSGGGGGGGAGGSPEPQSNVEVKELSQAFVTSGNSVRFDFPRNATSVLYITFNSKKTTEKTTTIVEMLKGKSTLVSQLPSGEVYKSLNIWVGNSGFATPNNIENSIVCFKVEKSWLQDKGINRSSITLNRYNDKKWNSLPTSLFSEDNKYLYFTAQTPGFSPFAITGNTIASGTGIQPTNVTNTQPGADTKIQPGVKTENIVQNNTASGTIQGSEQKSEQKSEKGKSSNLPVFGMICLISLVLVVFLFRIDKKP